MAARSGAEKNAFSAVGYYIERKVLKMNEKDIYELIGESFEDKIRLDFDDVKKRIEMLDDNKVTPMKASAPSAGKKRKVFTIIGTAAAASLVFIFGLSVFFSQFAGVKEEAAYAAYDTEAACEESEIFYAPTENEAYGYPAEDNADIVFSDTEDMDELQMETISESDLSESDIESDSDSE